MRGHAAQDYWEHVGLAKLIGGLLLPPFAWLLDLQVSYASVKWACAADARWVLLVLPIGSLALIVLATWMSWTCWTMLRDDGGLEGARLQDRSYVLALGGLAMSAFFALLILTSYAPRYFLSPCE
jgi:hypothetical protein